MITPDLLKSIAPQAKAPELWAPALQAAAEKYAINTPQRLAMWLAQLAHESMGFSRFREIWGPEQVPAQKRYERDFAAAWPPTQADQRNRKAFELGNDEKGDGFKYRGRGCIQITGKANYAKYGEMIGVDLVASPERAEEPEIAAEIAARYWSDHKSNWLADSGDFENITRAINGGLNGWPDRKKWLARIERIMGV